MRRTIILPLFFAIAVLELFSEITQNQYLTYITKPLLMIILSTYFLISTADSSNRFSRLLFLGLLFSIGGDTFLMFDGSLFFMFGLGCFLITHLFYIAAFFTFQSFSKKSIRQNTLLILILIVYLFSLMSYLWDDLEGLKIPVAIYGTVISTMAFAAANLRIGISKRTFIILFSGVLLFILSDSIIALSKFKSEALVIPHRDLIVMTSYIIAQYLIVSSALNINKLGIKRD